MVTFQICYHLCNIIIHVKFCATKVQNNQLTREISNSQYGQDFYYHSITSSGTFPIPNKSPTLDAKGLQCIYYLNSSTLSIVELKMTARDTGFPLSTLCTTVDSGLGRGTANIQLHAEYNTHPIIVILYFPIAHNSLRLPPKFCISCCCEKLSEGLCIPKSISQQWYMQNLRTNRVNYGYTVIRKYRLKRKTVLQYCLLPTKRKVATQEQRRIDVSCVTEFLLLYFITFWVLVECLTFSQFAIISNANRMNNWSTTHGFKVSVLTPPLVSLFTHGNDDCNDAFNLKDSGIWKQEKNNTKCLHCLLNCYVLLLS